MSPGQTFTFVLVPERKDDRTQREREQERICHDDRQDDGREETHE